MTLLKKSHILIAITVAMTAISLFSSCQNETNSAEASPSGQTSTPEVDLAKQEEAMAESTLITRIRDLNDTQNNLRTVARKLSEISLVIHHLAVSLDDTEALMPLRTELERTSDGFLELSKLVEKSSTALRTHHFQANNHSISESNNLFFSSKADSTGNELSLLKSLSNSDEKLARITFNQVPFAEFIWGKEGYKTSAFDVGAFLDSIKIDTEQSLFAKFCHLNTGESPEFDLMLDCKLNIPTSDPVVTTDQTNKVPAEVRIRLSKSLLEIDNVKQEISGIRTLLFQIPGIQKFTIPQTDPIQNAIPLASPIPSTSPLQPSLIPSAEDESKTEKNANPEVSPSPLPQTSPRALSSSNPTTSSDGHTNP